jgi:Pyocin activator protein PrtN
MNTVFLLLARHNGLPVIPVDDVCRDYFTHLTVEKFLRKVLAGEIDLPIVRVEGSQKTAKGVPITDLAAYLDERMALARKERDQLMMNVA